MKTLTLHNGLQATATEEMNLFLTIIAATLFAQVVPEPEVAKSAFAQLIDQYNGVLNTLTAGAILWLIKFVRDKVKTMFGMYETVVKVTETVIQTKEQIEAVAKKLDKTSDIIDQMKHEMQQVKANTSEDVQALKKQFIEVLDEWARIKKNLNL